MVDIVSPIAARGSHLGSGLLYWKPALNTKFGKQSFSNAGPAALEHCAKF